VLTVQFKVGVPRTEALVRLYDVLNANQDWLPRNLGTLTPIVKPKGIDDVPVLASRCGARDAAGADLERVAHTHGGRAQARARHARGATIGGPGRVVQVALDPQRLRERGVDVLRLQQTLAAANLGMPSGSVVDTRQGRAAGRGRPASSCARPTRWATWWWACSNGKPVYLREVAEVAPARQPQRRLVHARLAARPGAAARAAGGRSTRR
jgi:multidrug efflux pump subunit AcrB